MTPHHAKEAGLIRTHARVVTNGSSPTRARTGPRRGNSGIFWALAALEGLPAMRVTVTWPVCLACIAGRSRAAARQGGRVRRSSRGLVLDVPRLHRERHSGWACLLPWPWCVDRGYLQFHSEGVVTARWLFGSVRELRWDEAIYMIVPRHAGIVNDTVGSFVAPYEYNDRILQVLRTRPVHWELDLQIGSALKRRNNCRCTSSEIFRMGWSFPTGWHA